MPHQSSSTSVFLEQLRFLHLLVGKLQGFRFLQLVIQSTHHRQDETKEDGTEQQSHKNHKPFFFFFKWRTARSPKYFESPFCVMSNWSKIFFAMYRAISRTKMCFWFLVPLTRKPDSSPLFQWFLFQKKKKKNQQTKNIRSFDRFGTWPDVGQVSQSGTSVVPNRDICPKPKQTLTLRKEK